MECFQNSPSYHVKQSVLPFPLAPEHVHYEGQGNIKHERNLRYDYEEDIEDEDDTCVNQGKDCAEPRKKIADMPKISLTHFHCKF